MKNTRLLIILSVIAFLLALPAIAMQFTHEVNWSLSDFIIMGILLLTTGLAIEVVLRVVTTTGARLALCGAILFAFLLVWAELAVGIFGTPFAGS